MRGGPDFLRALSADDRTEMRLDIHKVRDGLMTAQAWFEKWNRRLDDGLQAEFDW